MSSEADQETTSSEESSKVTELESQLAELRQETMNLREHLKKRDPGLAQDKESEVEDLMDPSKLRSRRPQVPEESEDETKGLRDMTIEQYDAYRDKKAKSEVEGLKKQVEQLSGLVREFAGRVNLRMAQQNDPYLKELLTNEKGFDRIRDAAEAFPNATFEQVSTYLQGLDALERERSRQKQDQADQEANKTFTERDGLPQDMTVKENMTEDEIRELTLRTSGMKQLFNRR